jgi:hypothetical protein
LDVFKITGINPDEISRTDVTSFKPKISSFAALISNSDITTKRTVYKLGNRYYYMVNDVMDLISLTDEDKIENYTSHLANRIKSLIRNNFNPRSEEKIRYAIEAGYWYRIAKNVTKAKKDFRGNYEVFIPVNDVHDILLLNDRFDRFIHLVHNKLIEFRSMGDIEFKNRISDIANETGINIARIIAATDISGVLSFPNAIKIYNYLVTILGDNSIPAGWIPWNTVDSEMYSYKNIAKYLYEDSCFRLNIQTDTLLPNAIKTDSKLGLFVYKSDNSSSEYLYIADFIKIISNVKSIHSAASLKNIITKINDHAKPGLMSVEIGHMLEIPYWRMLNNNDALASDKTNIFINRVAALNLYDLLTRINEFPLRVQECLQLAIKETGIERFSLDVAFKTKIDCDIIYKFAKGYKMPTFTEAIKLYLYLVHHGYDAPMEDEQPW